MNSPYAYCSPIRVEVISQPTKCPFSTYHCIATGFIEALKSEKIEFTLVALQVGVSSAVGATALGAEEAGLSLPIDYAANTYELFHYRPE